MSCDIGEVMERLENEQTFSIAYNARNHRRSQIVDDYHDCLVILGDNCDTQFSQSTYRNRKISFFNTLFTDGTFKSR